MSEEPVTANQVDASVSQDGADVQPEALGAQSAVVGVAAPEPEAAEAESGDYTLTLPEGLSMPDEAIGAYSQFARENGLTKDSAQALMNKLAPVMAERSASALKAEIEANLTATRTDQEFGGERLAENLAVANKAYKVFGTPELTAVLKAKGLEDHPEIIRAFYRAGKSISEDGFVAGGQPAAQKGDPRRFYPNTKMNP